MTSEAEWRVHGLQAHIADARLRNGRCTGSVWLIDAPSLTALIEFGMSDALIVRYFGVGAREVRDLLGGFGQRERALERGPG